MSDLVDAALAIASGEQRRARLRRLVLADALAADDADSEADAEARTPRCRVWMALLHVGPRVDAEYYLSLVDSGPSPDWGAKIRLDTGRTFRTDPRFQRRVPEAAISRCLNAFALSNRQFGYVQGMNVLAAPFLFTMPEVEAYYSFSRFITALCPRYVAAALDGAHDGIKLLDRCMREIDPPLWKYLKSKGANPQVYAFAQILSFCAGVPPLSEVLRLWDFFIACGFHLNVLCVLARILHNRRALLDARDPLPILQKMALAPLDAKRTMTVAVQIVRELPAPLYDLLARHPFEAVDVDAAVAD